MYFEIVETGVRKKWTDARDFATSKGGKIPTTKQLEEIVAKYGPLIKGDLRVPIIDSTKTDLTNYMQIGSENGGGSNAGIYVTIVYPWFNDDELQ